MPVLLVAQRWRQRPVHVHVGHRGRQVPAPAPPQPRPHRVEGLLQPDDIPLAEAPREIARRRRARDHLRPQGVHVGRVVAQAAQVLQPRAPARQVVGDVQHMVRLVVRQVPLQQRQPPVDLPGQPELGHQLPDHAEHRARPGGPRPPRPGVPRLHLPPAPGTVPAALFVRYSLHRKGLLVDVTAPRAGSF